MFPDFFVQAFRIVEDSWKFIMLLLYMIDQFLGFQVQMDSYSSNWNTLTKAGLSQLVNFKNAIWHFRRMICNKILF